MKIDRRRRLRGHVVKVGAEKDAFWLLDTSAPSASRWRLENVNFASSPTVSGGHIRIDDDQMIFRNMTVFSGTLTNWAAIRWGVFGLLHLGVIRRQRIRSIFRIRQLQSVGGTR